MSIWLAKETRNCLYQHRDRVEITSSVYS